MTARHPLAIVVDPGTIVLAAGGVVGETPVDGTYVDPHLAVLLFLFGFCLLYAVLLAVDVATRRRSPDPNPEE
jgi:hypothetical protein